ncbi:unnamed protein product, partial [marine sediment metagenome]
SNFIVFFGDANMALVKYGGGVVQMSGSIAGSVFARNKSGNYVRPRTKPVNPKSERQVDAREIIKQLAAHWHTTLNDTHRGGWENYADAVPMKNKLGETIHLSGFNHFIRSNSARLGVGLAIVEAGPTTPALPPIDESFGVTTSAYYQALVIAFKGTDGWDDEVGAAMIITAGRPQLATRNTFHGPWRTAEAIEGEEGATPASNYSVAAPFTLTAGQIIWCSHRIARADGRLSNPSRFGPVT